MSGNQLRNSNYVMVQRARSQLAVSHRPLKAFTLIELLVVISIVALLIAMLLPALSKARATALGIKCLASIRQIGIGSRMYAASNREIISARSTDTWPLALSPYVGQQAETKYTTAGTPEPDKRQSLWWCQGNPFIKAPTSGTTNIGMGRYASYLQNVFMGSAAGGDTYIRYNPMADSVTRSGSNSLKYSDFVKGNPVGWTCAGFWKAGASAMAASHDLGGTGIAGTGPDHATKPNVGPGYWHNRTTTAAHLDGSAKAYTFEAATLIGNNPNANFFDLRRR